MIRRPFMKKHESYLGHKLDTNPRTNKKARELADKAYGNHPDEFEIETKEQLKELLHGIEDDAKKLDLKVMGFIQLSTPELSKH